MKRIDIKTPDGKPILSLHFVEQGTNNNGRANGSGNHRAYGGNNGRRQNNNGNSNGNGNGQENDAMSDAQKRYLFRILAEQGLEGDAALEHLKERLGVDNLANADKRDASVLIDELVNAPAVS